MEREGEERETGDWRACEEWRNRNLARERYQEIRAIDKSPQRGKKKRRTNNESFCWI